MDWEEIQIALHTWAAAQSGGDCYWADQDFPKQARPFVLLEIGTVRSTGTDEVVRTYAGPPDDNLTTSIQGVRDFVLQAQAFSKGVTFSTSARQYVEALRDSLIKPSVLTAFSDANIAVIQAQATQNIGRVVNGENESRWGLNVQFAASMNISDTPTDYVKTVEVTGTIDGETLTTFTVSDS